MYYMTKRNLLTTIGMLAVVSAFAQKEYPSRAPMTPIGHLSLPSLLREKHRQKQSVHRLMLLSYLMVKTCLNGKTLKDKLRDGLFMMEYSQ